MENGREFTVLVVGGNEGEAIPLIPTEVPITSPEVAFACFLNLLGKLTDVFMKPEKPNQII